MKSSARAEPHPSKPVLWHIPVSHFSEKARWALAFKGVEHERRAPVPGVHMLYALWLSRGAVKTFPILQLDGENIAESSEIIAALERRHPEPPLYPADPLERSRALELERYFDDLLGPQIRLLAWHEIIADSNSDAMRPVATSSLPGPLRSIGPLASAATRAGSEYVRLRYRVAGADAAAAARVKVVESLDRLEAELGEGDYLVGDRFSVADLTAASLFYPLVRPPEGPQVIEEEPPRLSEFLAPLRERRGAEWVREMFRRHRK